jgi:hypothetical protein
MFTAALYTRTTEQKNPRCSSRNESYIKMWDSHTMEHYSGFKRMEIAPCATTWVNPEDLMLYDTS